MKKMYVIRDDVSGMCGDPFVSPNCENILRSLADPEITPAHYLRDISVLCLAEYDDLGEVPVIKPLPAPIVALNGPTIYNAWHAKLRELNEVSSKEVSCDEE